MTEEIEATEPQQQYTHSLKLEDTAKGIRISVHVHANDSSTAIKEAFQTYMTAQQTARDSKIPLAPANGNEK